MEKEELKLRYEKVLENIKSLDKDGKVTLLLATKTQNAEDINYLISQGVKVIGENRVNELCEKYESYSKGVEIHLIGTLQKNKVKYIIDKADLIHSLDTLSLAEEINKRAEKIGKVQRVLIEVNSGREEAKSGIMPEEVYDFYKKCLDFKNIKVEGLMTMAPRCEKKEEYMKYFLSTKEIFDKIFKEDKNAILSMGMSESYMYAIEAGANMVRVGSAIFGERTYK